jgi:hypothetical protein
MIPLDLPPKLILPERPAIIRAGEIPSPAIIRAWKREEQRRGMMFPMPAFCPSAGPTTLTFVTTATADATSINVPSGPTAAAGDLAILMDLQSGPSAATTVNPSGWDEIVNSTTTGLRSICSWKILTGGDLGASVTGMTASGGVVAKMILVLRPDQPITTVSELSVNQQSTSADPTLQTITSSNGPTPLVVIGTFRGSGGTPTPSGTLNTTGTALTFASATVRGRYHIYNSSPSDLTWDCNDIGSQTLLSFYLSVA